MPIRSTQSHPFASLSSMKIVHDIYFPFADGMLTYDCQACGSKCCKQGGGFGLPRTAFNELSQHYPALSYFGRATGSADYISVSGIGPRCFLLEQDGGCSIQRNQGLEAKPFTCRAFPANQFHWLGNVLIVDLHRDCPIQMNHENPANSLLDHAALRQFIVDHEYVIAERATREHQDFPEAKLPDLIANEVRCRDLFLQNAESPSLQVAAAWEESETTRELEAFEAMLVDFLQIRAEMREESSEIDRQLLSLFARLRMHCILQLTPLPYAELVRVFPRLFVASRLFVQLSQSVSQTPLSLSTIHGTITDNLSMLWLLAQLDRIPQLAVSEGDDFNVRLPRSQQLAVSTVLSFIAMENGKMGLTLGQILEEKAPSLPSDRLMLLRSIPVELLRRLRF
jgi:Fe-S-cluster containining protein